MKRFYAAEVCVFIEAENEAEAQRIAEQSSMQAQAVDGVTSTSLNTVEESEEAAARANWLGSSCTSSWGR